VPARSGRVEHTEKRGPNVDYGRKFLQLAHDAIQLEEEELKQLKADQHSNFGSTRQCDEAWQKYFILKHAIRIGFRPKLFSELPCGKKHIDLYFVDGSGATLAVFELKPGNPNPTLAERIADDCEKLRDLSDIHSETQKYVVGIVCGSPSKIKAWEETLTEYLRKSNVITHRVAELPDIPSNEGGVIIIVMLRVTAAATMKAGA